MTNWVGVILLDSAGRTLPLPVCRTPTVDCSSLGAVRVKKVAAATGRLIRNDGAISVDDFASGIRIYCDADIERDSTGALPTCTATIELPFPFTRADHDIWGPDVVGAQPLHVASTTDANKTVITWSPTKAARVWLTERLLTTLKRRTGEDRVLAHFTLSGNFGWQTEPSSIPNRWRVDGLLDGTIDLRFWLVEVGVDTSAIAILPVSATVETGSHLDFVVTLDGTPNSAVDMVMVPPGTGTLVPSETAPGVWTYTAPVVIPAINPVRIVATSLADPTSVATGEVTVHRPGE